jgi:uncharacterized protein (TIGR00299 family) protein
MNQIKTAYLNCIGGISGDMLLGALVDAGVSIDELNLQLLALGRNNVYVSGEISQRNGVRGTKILVNFDHEGESPYRFQDFIDIIKHSSLSSRVISKSVDVFQRLAHAESLVHGVEETDLHLHELGTLDTLVDVVASVIGLDVLGIENLFCSPLPTGSGVIDSEHGKIPAFSPVTARLVAISNAPVVPAPGNVQDAGEMVTPTGAALVTTMATFTQPTITLEKIGYGLGERDSCHFPNVVSIWVGEGTELSQSKKLILLETNIDNMNPEHLSFVHERLFDVGARDVWFTPIQMKKNRPAIKLSAIVDFAMESKAVELIMRETPTLGVRVSPVDRYEAGRAVVQIETSLGVVNCKLKKLDGLVVSLSPEYEDCRKIAIREGIPIQDVYNKVRVEAEEILSKDPLE